MRFIHISDLHLGLKLINRDLIKDQEYILDRIVELAGANKVDAVVIAGDIYDKAIPSAEAVTLFDGFINKLSKALCDAPVLAISGNHDSAPRLDLYRNILKKHNFYMIGMPPASKEDHIERVTLTDEYGEVDFYLLPFIKPSMIKAIVGTDENGNNLSYRESLKRLLEREVIDMSKRNVLVSHQFYLPAGKNADDIERMESEIVTVGNIDAVGADMLMAFDYAALGHIHKPMTVGEDRFRYSGTPMAYSADEAGQIKGALLVDLGPKGELSVNQLPIVPLHEVRVITGSYKELLNMSSDDYIFAVITDTTDLDVIDMQDRMRHAFPNLLEIRRQHLKKASYKKFQGAEKVRNPFELCMDFIGEADEEDMELLKDVINTVTEENR
ncbi:exonuclease SbcCD subunit D [Butyrivibrio sp. MC2013]|uniref:exonuclease SbcCD subunit D n=1 Tax=Butyrivibrio sp. MC2013 TaxID=1280686 RepID=UPI000417E284|nr:exonuclease SbcCD subunit D [Butyrivibrio sp. MC2013]